MRTLNEQIQRLRDVLVTCYNAIKRKGGTIPEEGLRNMTNLPAAVLSIPQSHGVLTELNVTKDGAYFPADHDADGFSKVTAKFDTSSLPKVKQINTLRVSLNCINADGIWEGGAVLDTSEMTSFYNMFNQDLPLKYVDVSSWNTSKIASMSTMFNECTNIDNLDVSDWDTSSVKEMGNMFYECTSLKSLDLTNWDVSNVSGIGNMFYQCTSLTDLVGGRTIEDVLDNNICALKGLKKSIHLAYAPKNRASMRAVINGLADLTGQTPQEIVFGGSLELLEEEDLAILTEKNWTTR